MNALDRPLVYCHTRLVSLLKAGKGWKCPICGKRVRVVW